MASARTAELADGSAVYALPGAPSVPAAVDGLLDLGGRPGDVMVDIPVYEDYTAFDSITLHFGDLCVPVPGPGRQRAPGSVISLAIPATDLHDGNADVWYLAVDAAGNAAPSGATAVKVVNAPCARLPAPTFPAYGRNRAPRGDILRAGGVMVRVSTAGLQAGDRVSLAWTGYFATGAVAPDAARLLMNRLVTADDLARTWMEAWAEMSAVLAAGPDGYGNARYAVMRGPAGSQVLTGVSALARLQILDNAALLLAAATSGVSVRQQSQPWLTPANRLWLAATPFSEIEVSVDGGAVFDVSPPAGATRIATDVRGLAVLDFYLAGSFSGNIACTVTARLMPGPGQSAVTVTVQTSFRPSWRVGNGTVLYSAPDFAVADGADFCMVCAHTPAALTTMPVQLARPDGSGCAALVCGCANPYTSMTHLDFSCTVNILDAVAETVRVTLGDDDNLAVFDVAFRKSPFAQA